MENKLKATARVLEVMDTLREQCPWDREQTFASLRNNTIEEAFELTDAITDGDMEGIKEELGDVLLHIVFYSKMADEQGKFDFADVCNALCEKLIYRHPHIYSDVIADSPEEVKQNWEALKLRKKARKGGLLGGVPRSLPAMVKAFRIGEKAASAGFDWEQKQDVWQKVHEEIAEVEAEMRAENRDNIESEIDDPRIMLMYGVPFPDGEVARPIDPEQAKEEIEALKREAEKGAEQEASAAENEGVPFEDGSIVKPISEEEAKKLIEELKQGNEEAAQQAAQENQ